MTYDDTQLLAKTAEEQLLFRDMADAAALRIIRRLHSIPAGSAS
jgi:LPS-assembly lipoprotein